MTAVKVCGQPHPDLRYETGHKVRCVLDRGHIDEGAYQHFDSFAMRSWEDPDLYGPEPTQDPEADR